jgi:hypothetical protein
MSREASSLGRVVRPCRWAVSLGVESFDTGLKTVILE